MIPIFNIAIESDECGVDKISLVEYPAVESNFLAFSDNSKQVILSIENEEKQMVTGVLARCDYPIYRNDEQLGEYFIQFDKSVIVKMAEKMLKENHQNSINIEHKENSDIKGVDMVELFIKDSEKGVNPKGFEDIKDGSLFATYHINNSEIWNKIKNGTFKGFSIEGLFDFEKEDKEIENDAELDEILSLLDELYKKTHSK